MPESYPNHKWAKKIQIKHSKSVLDLLLSFLQALAFTIGPALGPAQSFKDGHKRCGQKFGQRYGVYRPRIFKEIDVFSSILAQYRLPIYIPF